MTLKFPVFSEAMLVSILGPAGTGKTLLALAAGLHQVINQGRYTKLIVSRALIPHSRDIGTLPGSKEEKLSPWMGAIYDNLEYLTRNFAGNKYDKRQSPAEQVDKFMEEGFIELEALAYIRGRSIPGHDYRRGSKPHQRKHQNHCNQGR